MQRIKRTVGGILMSAGIAFGSVVTAAPIEIVEVVTGGPTSVKVGAPIEVEHDLRDNGYAPDSDVLTSAELVVVLFDDHANEHFTIAFGTPSIAGSFSDLEGYRGFTFSVPALALASGMLDVTISATGCTGNRCGSYAFKFVSSTLTAQVERPQALTTATAPDSAQAPTAVPEPGTLALLGLGLAGLVGLRRRR